jgi:membrane protease YdiL (CAAX protease family)
MQDHNASVNSEQPVPWTGAEIVLSVFLAWMFWPAAIFAILKGVHVEHWYYGDEAPEMTKRLGLWVNALASPFQVVTYPLVFSAFHRITLEQLGLTRRRLVRNVFGGVAVLLLLTPVVFGIWQFIRWTYGSSGEHALERHTLEEIAQQQLYPSEWVLLFFTAMIAAPLHEELTFRGILQPWLAARPWGGHAAMFGAFVLALALRHERLLAAWSEDLSALTNAAAPALFVLAMLPLYLMVWAVSRTPLMPALFGTSLLFACLHAPVWPTPIPLFVLALGLGTLAQRTRSLVGPIVMHSLFNSFSCVLLLAERI